MPCNSEHLSQTPREAALQRAAKVCWTIANRLDIGIPTRIFLVKDEYYARDVGQTEWACEKLREHFPKMKLDILAPDDRDLVAWWEEHQIVDIKRDLKATALAKLTPEEREALGYEP